MAVRHIEVSLRGVDILVRHANGWRKGIGMGAAIPHFIDRRARRPALLGGRAGGRQHGRGKPAETRAGPWRDPFDRGDGL